MTESGPCKYCGEKTSNTDQYAELECQTCRDFWRKNPTPPVAPPDGTVLISLDKAFKALKG